MIKYQDAVRVARQQLGTPYGTRPGELDCINLIKLVIRKAPGGVPGYTTAGVNSLWDSYESSPKYKDLTWRKTSIEGARAGMIAFKLYGLNDVGHAGIVTDVGTVIHASSEYGETVETPLSASQGWDLLGIHRYISVADSEEETVMYKATVELQSSSSLNLRNGPGTEHRIIGSVPNGAEVNVLAADGSWAYIRYEDRTGYVAAEYLDRASEDMPDVPDIEVVEKSVTTLIDASGATITLVGDWRVAED